MTVEPATTLQARLNHDCFCIDVDATAVWSAVERAAAGIVPAELLARERPHLFSQRPVFLAQAELAGMERVVAAVETAARSPDYQAAALAWTPEIARTDHGPRGVLMGYDFHLTPDGPKLIEVNTNAGGAFLNALLTRAQVACCPEVAAAAPIQTVEGFEDAIWNMFLSEWRLQGRTGAPRVIAIVDEAPSGQYLYPEFLLAQALLEQRGVETVILDPADLSFSDGRLVAHGLQIDLVYNRLCDFAFATRQSSALREAYAAGAVVVTPNPRNHALLADKRNLVFLTDADRLAAAGLDPETIAALAGGPRTQFVTPENADALWAGRKGFFFKPAAGHAGKAVYRGDKLTRGVWTAILTGDYVAQAFAAPSERRVQVDGVTQVRKMDVRLYTYAGKTLLAAARLYSGQTTNFRTPGGGFAPVITLPESAC